MLYSKWTAPKVAYCVCLNW